MKFLNLFRSAFEEEVLMRFDCTPELEARLARAVGVISPANLEHISKRREYCAKIGALAGTINQEYESDAELENQSPAAQAMYEMYMGDNNKAIALLPKMSTEEIDALIYDAIYNSNEGLDAPYPLLEFGKSASAEMRQELLLSALDSIDEDQIDLLTEILDRPLSTVEIDLLIIERDSNGLPYTEFMVVASKYGASTTMARLMARSMIDADDDHFAEVMNDLEAVEEK